MEAVQRLSTVRHSDDPFMTIPKEHHMHPFRAFAWLALGFLLGLAGGSHAATTTPSTVYSVGVEYCNGKGQVDQYTTIRSGWQAWTNRVQHADLNPGSIGYVAVSRRTAPSRPFYEIDHRSWSCP